MVRANAKKAITVIGTVELAARPLVIELGHTFGLWEQVADAGPVTPAELASITGIREADARLWLRAQAAAGYLDRDEFGRYASWCPWPRVA